MINNVEELLKEAEKITDKENKVKFIMNYFLENVKYNYAYLFAKGYAGGDITAVSNQYGIAFNKTRDNGDQEFALTQKVIEGNSRIFEDILKLRDDNSGKYEEFIAQLREYITRELNKHLENDIIVSETVNTLMQRIMADLKKTQKINYNGEEFLINYDISKVLIDYFLNPNEHFPAEFNNGLIVNGVCQNYADYLVPLLQKAGIEAHRVDGTSEMGHAWVIAKVGDEYKSIDLTRAVFIRDGFLGIPKEQKSEDWLYSNVEDIFRMQETRRITEIDGKLLPNIINAQNFNDEAFKKMMEEQEIDDATLKTFLKKGLERGITETEALSAEKNETTKEREEKINE